MSTSREQPAKEGGSKHDLFEIEVAELLVTTLHLEMRATDIDPQAALFGDELGLDSIDALEIALAISRQYGMDLKSDDEHNLAIFASLRSLARYVETHRTR